MIELSRELDKGGNSVVLGDEMIPHITVYDLEIPEKNVSSAFGALESIADSSSIFSIDFDSYDKPPRGDNGVFINYKNEGHVRNLFNKVVEAINPLREGVIRTKYKYSPDPDGEIEQYGYPLSYYHFPHVTLARFQNKIERDGALEKLENHTQGKITVRSIAVVETGDHGTAKKIIREFLLQ